MASPTLTQERTQPRSSEWIAWIAVIFVAAFLLILVDFQTRDPDSGLHVALVVKMAELPASEWIAPQWWNVWDVEGLYREHPAGILLLPLLLTKVGYPAEQAPFLANAVYQIVSLVLVVRVAAFLVPPLESRTLGWFVQFLPIAFTYRIRANHEHAILMFFLAALWATEKARKDARWTAILLLAAAGTFLVKGIFVTLLLLACAFWLITIRRPDGEARSADKWAWIGVAGAGMFAAGMAAAYEAAYRQVTRESFFSVYLSRQFGAAAIPRGGAASAFNKAYNFCSYTGRLLWFAFPASLAGVAAGWNRLRKGLRRCESRMDDGLLFAVGFSAVYVLLFSLSDRIADRYIFPAYYLLGGCGAVAALRRWPAARAAAQHLDRYQPFVTPALWLLLFGLNLISGAMGLPRIKL